LAIGNLKKEFTPQLPSNINVQVPCLELKYPDTIKFIIFLVNDHRVYGIAAFTKNLFLSEFKAQIFRSVHSLRLYFGKLLWP